MVYLYPPYILACTESTQSTGRSVKFENPVVQIAINSKSLICFSNGKQDPVVNEEIAFLNSCVVEYFVP